MRLGLFMMVKDEAQTIQGCLANILDLFADAVIVDTGSNDGTPDLVRALGVEPAIDELELGRCYSHADVRNRGFARLNTPWIFCLDADERVDREALQAIVRGDPPPEAGWFSRWTTIRADGTSFEDYKCSLFQHGVTKRGLIHDNVQVDLRRRGLRATWQDKLEIQHYPDWSKGSTKRRFYLERLGCAIRLEPEWYRYHWFAGYTYFSDGDWNTALHHLQIAADSHSHLFPVECLNSKIVLAELHARMGKQHLIRPTIESALAFYGDVANDFEVRVNFRLRRWLDNALTACTLGNWTDIRCYDFAC